MSHVPGVKLLIVSVLLFLCNVVVNATTSAIWYLNGVAQNGTSLTLNVGDSFVITCVGKSGTTLTSGVFPAVVIMKGAPLATYTITAPTDAVLPGLVTTGGVLIFDTVNGIYPGFDNILPVPNFLPLYVEGVLTQAQVSLYNPFVGVNDAGDYYCNYITGDSLAQDGNDSYGTSAPFTLIINPPKSRAIRSTTDWRMKYPILLASAAKILL